MPIVIHAKVIPLARCNKITHFSHISSEASQQNFLVQIKVAAAPDKDAANRAVISLLAEKFRVNKSKIHIIRGMHFRQKIIKIIDD